MEEMSGLVKNDFFTHALLLKEHVDVFLNPFTWFLLFPGIYLTNFIFPFWSNRDDEISKTPGCSAAL